MNPWEEIKVGDLGRIVTGKTPKTAEKDNYDGNIMFVTPSDNMDAKYIVSTGKLLTEKGKCSVKGAIIPAGSVCVSCIGSDLGKVVITTEECVTNQQINSIVVNTNKYDIDFVYYSMLVLGKELNFHSKTSTAVPIVNKSSFSSFSIRCPSLETQKRIAGILSSIDNKIITNESINQNLAEQRMALFKSWFIRFDPFMGQRPNSWKIIQFSDFLIERKEKSNDPDIPLYSITDTGIYPREKKFNKKLSAKTTFNKVLYKNDLAFGMSREILNWGVMKDTVGAVSSAYNVYSVNNGISSVYLELFMKSKIRTFRDLIRPATREGQSIDKGCLMNKIIYYPDETILERYLIFDSIFENKMSVIQKETNALQELRDTLLPKLMSGELDVSGVGI